MTDHNTKTEINYNDFNTLTCMFKTNDLNVIKSIVKDKELIDIKKYKYFLGSALEYAAENGHLNILIYIIDTIDFIYDHKFFMGPLRKAAENNQLSIVKYIINECPEEYHTIDIINKATVNAIIKNHLKIVKFLVNEAGADIQPKGDITIYTSNPRALIASIDKGHLRIVKFLLTKILINDSILKFALYHAIKYGHFYIVRYLVEEAGAESIIHDSYKHIAENEWALHYATIYCSLELIKYFISKHSDAVSANVDDKLIIRAVKTQRMDIIRYYLEPAPEGIGIRFNNNDSILYWITHYDFREIIDYFIEKGITYNEVFIMAARHGNNILLQRYIKDNLLTINYINPLDVALQKASEHGFWQTVKNLIKWGANVDADNNYALRVAAGNGNLPIVKVLVKAGANIHVDNDALLKAIYSRKYVKKNKVVEYLKSLRI